MQLLRTKPAPAPAQEPEQDTRPIYRYGPEGFAKMRKAGRLAAECLDMLVPFVKPGVSTATLDRLILQFALDHGAMPATMHYRGYPHTCCTSLNHVVCHGMPSSKALRDGDILNIDTTLIVDGWYGDTSRMYVAGEASRRAERLIEVTYRALMLGVQAVQPGRTVGHIGHAIQTYAEGERCSVVQEFCGHGIGDIFHSAPNINHYGKAGEGPELVPGMIFTIEPMINAGKSGTKVSKEDGWTAVTRDRQLSAQFEHTVGVTETGVEIFTVSPGGHHIPGRTIG
jgi:methionyl aminopeptidase